MKCNSKRFAVQFPFNGGWVFLTQTLFAQSDGAGVGIRVFFTARQHEPQPQCAVPVAKTEVHYTQKSY